MKRVDLTISKPRLTSAGELSTETKAAIHAQLGSLKRNDMGYIWKIPKEDLQKETEEDQSVRPHSTSDLIARYVKQQGFVVASNKISQGAKFVTCWTPLHLHHKNHSKTPSSPIVETKTRPKEKDDSFPPCPLPLLPDECESEEDPTVDGASSTLPITEAVVVTRPRDQSQPSQKKRRVAVHPDQAAATLRVLPTGSEKTLFTARLQTGTKWMQENVVIPERKKGLPLVVATEPTSTFATEKIIPGEGEGKNALVLTPPVVATSEDVPWSIGYKEGSPRIPYFRPGTRIIYSLPRMRRGSEEIKCTIARRFPSADVLMNAGNPILFDISPWLDADKPQPIDLQPRFLHTKGPLAKLYDVVGVISPYVPYHLHLGLLRKVPERKGDKLCEVWVVYDGYVHVAPAEVLFLCRDDPGGLPVRLPSLADSPQPVQFLAARDMDTLGSELQAQIRKDIQTFFIDRYGRDPIAPL